MLNHFEQEVRDGALLIIELLFSSFEKKKKIDEKGIFS